MVTFRMRLDNCDVCVRWTYDESAHQVTVVEISTPTGALLLRETLRGHLAHSVVEERVSHPVG